MESKIYEFSPEYAFYKIKTLWRIFAHNVRAKKWVVGISGGKDSTVVAALAARIFGPENVIGVMLPNGMQSDQDDSLAIIRHLGIGSLDLNINNAVNGIDNELYNEGLPISETAKINLPPRIRLAALYAVAQTVDGIVLNTSNLTEDMLGYATLWGDSCGSYAPIQALTVTEVMQIGDWLGLPWELVHKTPADGLQEQSDEERLGMKYADVDEFIRRNKGDAIFKRQVLCKYRANKFKLDMIRLEGPKFPDLPNYVLEAYRQTNLLNDVESAKEIYLH